MSATLTILGDASGVRRALGEVVAETRRAASAMSADARREGDQRRRREAEEIEDARAALRSMHRDRQRAAADRQRVEDAGRRQRERDQRAEAARRDRDERDRTRKQDREERERTRNARREQAERARDARRERAQRERDEREETRRHDREEKERTRTSRREQKERTSAAEAEARRRARAENAARRDARQQGRDVAGAVTTVGSHVVATARDLHGQYQDARRTRAIANRVVGNAVRNAGGDASAVAAAQGRVRAFVDETGMSVADVAAALETGQARGSALEPGEGQTRGDALNEALRIVREANAAGADAGQLLAARGRLGAAGLQGESLNQALRYTMRAAQRGSVEIDQIIQQGLPGAASLMNQRVAALGPGATAEQRQRAALQAYQESVAVQEVAASTGRQPGDTANTLASLQNFLRAPRRQEQMLTNLREAHAQINTRTPEGRARAAALRGLYEGETSLFERDPTRTGNAMRLREGVSPLVLAARVSQAMGGDANAAANIFAGGGHGNPQSLLVNMRNMLAFLGGQTPNGQTGGQRALAMMNGGGISNAEMRSMQDQVERDDLAEVTRNEERRVTALTDNTDALKGLSDRFANWAAAHPVASTVGQGATGLLGGLLAGRLPGFLGGLFGGGGSAAGAAAGAGAGAAAGVKAGTAATAVGGGLVTAGIASLLGLGAGAISAGADYQRGVAMQDGARREATERALGITTDRTAQGIGGPVDLSQRSLDGLAQALSRARIQATVDPHAAAHASSQTATAPRGRR